MGTFGLVLLWVGCVLLGALAGWLVGYVLWQLGFELLGGSVAVVGGGIGGILAFVGVFAWYDRRDRPGRASR
jgi:hypothetical protein